MLNQDTEQTPSTFDWAWRFVRRMPRTKDQASAGGFRCSHQYAHRQWGRHVSDVPPLHVSAEPHSIKYSPACSFSARAPSGTSHVPSVANCKLHPTSTDEGPSPDRQARYVLQALLTVGEDQANASKLTGLRGSPGPHGLPIPNSRTWSPGCTKLWSAHLYSLMNPLLRLSWISLFWKMHVVFFC